jgi:ribosomal protein L29
MNIKEIRGMNRSELVKHLAALREQARDLRFKIHSKEIKNNHSLTAVRKDIARILTTLNDSQSK